jgi:hypothetical protein
VPHAAHFLERLDRVPRALTDFALGLYRDEERVRWILHYAHLPKEEERVAFALDAEGRGPYVVVTREGKFVTALGVGMTPKNRTILSRAQVDTFSARVDDARSRMELAKEIVPPGKAPVDVLHLLTTRAWSLSREEFSAIGAWAPLLGVQLLVEGLRHLPDAEKIRTTFLTIREKKYRNDPRTTAALALLWNASHNLGACFALATMGDLEFADRWAKGADVVSGPTYFATLERIHSVAMRGAWAAARMGRPFLPLYKEILSTPGDMMIRYDAAIAMTAIGLRHARHRDEALRAVAAATASAYDWNVEWTKSWVAASERALTEPEAATAEVAAWGARMLVANRGRFVEGSAFRFDAEGDVPRDLGLLVTANSTHDSAHHFALYSLPWVAKLASPDELYYPEELERGLRPAWTPEKIEEVLSRRADPPCKPVTRDGPKIGRNDPCACGSGQKFKRCCALRVR